MAYVCYRAGGCILLSGLGDGAEDYVTVPAASRWVIVGIVDYCARQQVVLILDSGQDDPRDWFP
jgi:hypothetical protein